MFTDQGAVGLAGALDVEFAAGDFGVEAGFGAARRVVVTQAYELIGWSADVTLDLQVLLAGAQHPVEVVESALGADGSADGVELVLFPVQPQYQRADPR